MTVLEAIILGLVQGLTEFLPVSSSGHLLLFGKFLGVGTVSVGFELVCHLGTLAAVCLAMRKDIAGIIKKPFSRQVRTVIIATIPTVIIAGAISYFFRDILEGSMLVYCFIITGILLLCCGFASGQNEEKRMLYPHAAVIGAAQGIAALPGLSRSGVTMATATLLGYNREQSARFSFLISIPIIIGSSIVELALHGVGADVGAAALFAALVSSFASGLAAVTFMLKLLKKHSLDGFAIYLFLLSVFMLLNDYALHLF
ncbi:MAG: undecaprenyl-diphosphate phosphatase [Clostridia bacterium]|uniref:undecaprenyl-diphosphate phosphatase n=1 Tax=Pumilibacter muris TaxID=2941510 RepID=UPI0020421B5B|nr:undecaprenyl-diphosphate phosphatase [Pumilibacter muris]MCI8596084.1 undecaprenyl-diphosphate phosphatase [Clostridia bacterium]